MNFLNDSAIFQVAAGLFETAAKERNRSEATPLSLRDGFNSANDGTEGVDDGEILTSHYNDRPPPSPLPTDNPFSTPKGAPRHRFHHGFFGGDASTTTTTTTTITAVPSVALTVGGHMAASSSVGTFLLSNATVLFATAADAASSPPLEDEFVDAAPGGAELRPFIADVSLFDAAAPLGFWPTVVIGTLLLVLILCCVIGNLLVILAILLERDLRSRPQYYLIFSLAVADLLVGMIVTPLGAWATLRQAWHLGVTLCDFWISVDVLVCTSSILHLVAIALDRYWSITDIYYVQNRTPKRIFFMLMLIWILSLLISLAPIFGWKDAQFVARVREQHVCLISQQISYQVFSTATAFYIPLCAIIIVYYKIMRAAKKRFRRERDRRTVSRAAAATLENCNSHNDSAALCTPDARLHINDGGGGGAAHGGGARSKIARHKKSAPALLVPCHDFENSSSVCVTENGHFKIRYNDTVTVNNSTSEDDERTPVHPHNNNNNNMISNEAMCGALLGGYSNTTSSAASPMPTIGSPPLALSGTMTTTIGGGGGGAVSPLCETRFAHQQQPRKNNNGCQNNNNDKSDENDNNKNTKKKLKNGRIFQRNNNNNTHHFQNNNNGHVTNSVHYSSTAIASNGGTSKVAKSYYPRSFCFTKRMKLRPTAAANGITAANADGLSVTLALVSVAARRKKTRGVKESAEHRRERKAWRTLAIITGTFVACWTPFFLVSLYRPLCACRVPPAVENVTAWLGYLNSALNPIIYTVFSMDFRMAFQRILKRMCLIKDF